MNIFLALTWGLQFADPYDRIFGSHSYPDTHPYFFFITVIIGIVAVAKVIQVLVRKSRKQVTTEKG